MPSPLSANVPLDGLVKLSNVTGSPSGSLSLDNSAASSITSAVSSTTARPSSTASGAWFTGAETVKFTVAVSLSPPSSLIV